MPTSMTNAATGVSSAGNNLSSSVVSVFAASRRNAGKIIPVTMRRARRAITSSNALIT